MASEKPEYGVGAVPYGHESPEYQDKNVARRGSVAVGEAADLYGDIQTAEEYGYVARG